MFKRKNVNFMIKFHLKDSHNIRLSATKSKKQQETPKGQYRKKNYTKRETHALSPKRQKTQIPQIITQKTGATRSS